MTDTLERSKTLAVYGTAVTLVLAGNAGLFALILLDLLDAIAGVAIIGAQIGAGSQFLFGVIASKQTEQVMERANLVARSTVSGEVPPATGANG